MTAPDRPISVAALTGGKNVPSARFRIRALRSDLANLGIAVDEYTPAISKYPPTNRWLRPLWLPATLSCRLPGIAASHTHDITLLQRELVSTLYTAEGLTGKPRVLDVDDAIFLRRDGRSARRLAQSCNAVFAGNAFLADWFSQWQSNITVIPTAIDTRLFTPAHRAADTSTEPVVIGWTGSSPNLRYLNEIEPALAQVLKARPNAKLHVVCDKPPQLPALLGHQITWSAWHPAREVSDVQRFDIGIMPLADGDWERGKCAFKLLQYMACAKAVVASPVGVNAQLLQGNQIGMAAAQREDWESALLALIDDSALRTRCGWAGREMAQTRFGTTAIAALIAGGLRRVAAA